MLFRDAKKYPGGYAATEFGGVAARVLWGDSAGKAQLFRSASRNFPTAIEQGLEANACACMTDDCKKGIVKFLEK